MNIQQNLLNVKHDDINIKLNTFISKQIVENILPLLKMATTTTNVSVSADLAKYTKAELLVRCQELNITKCQSKTKPQLISLIQNAASASAAAAAVSTNYDAANVSTNNAAAAVPNTTLDPQNIRFIDLFCGIGGFHQALNRLNAKCVFACDIDEQCRKTYEQNYQLKPAGDISSIDITTIPPFDILCGGFPCQSFSNSGKKKGLDDKRGKLFEYILSIAARQKPSFLFLENVKHIKNIDDGKVFEHIIQRIRETGYFVTTTELSPHQLGVPQQRERVVFICIRNDLYDKTKSLDFPLPVTPIHLDRIFEKDTTVTAKYKIAPADEEILTVWDKMIQQFEVGENLSPTIMCNEFNRVYTPNEFALLPAWKQEYITKNKPIYHKYKAQWDQWITAHQALLTKKEVYGKLEWQAGKKKENDSIFHHFIQFRQSGIRVKKGEYFPTLVAIVQTPIYAKEKRYITPRECARLQSFPDDFIINTNDHVAYKQFGNAVNVDVVHFIISNTLRVYDIIAA